MYLHQSDTINSVIDASWSDFTIMLFGYDDDNAPYYRSPATFARRSKGHFSNFCRREKSGKGGREREREKMETERSRDVDRGRARLAAVREIGGSGSGRVHSAWFLRTPPNIHNTLA